MHGIPCQDFGQPDLLGFTAAVRRLTGIGSVAATAARRCLRVFRDRVRDGLERVGGRTAGERFGQDLVLCGVSDLQGE